MATAVKLAPAAGRKWLTFALGGFLILIGVGLVYRQMTGNTVADQRAISKRDKDSKDLANKTPGSAEAFSARLEAKRLQAEENAVKEAANKRPEPSVASELPAPSKTAVARIREADSKSGLLPPGAPDGPNDAQLDAYETLKAERTADAARRMGAWESSDRQRVSSSMGRGAGNGLDGLTPVQYLADQASTAAPSAAPGTSSSTAMALMEAYQRNQAAASGPGLGRDAAFLKQTSERQVLPPLQARPGLGRYALLEGSAVEVVMRTNVSSDIGGPCRGQISRNVFDTVTGQDLVIPAGAQVICTYNAEVVQGQERLLLAFTRLIYPSGASVQLGSMQAADAMGAIGAPAEVNSRFWKVFGSTFLVAAVTRMAQSTQTSSVTVNVGGAGGAAGGVAANVLAEVARKALERNLNIKPELRVNAGDRLNLVVARDMVLDPAVTGVAR